MLGRQAVVRRKRQVAVITRAFTHGITDNNLVVSQLDPSKNSHDFIFVRSDNFSINLAIGSAAVAKMCIEAAV
jgi:hypothetical protein